MASSNDIDAFGEQFSNLAISTGTGSRAQLIATQETSLRRRSPVDVFFHQYAARPGSNFTYDPDVNINIRKTFNKLAKVQKWGDEKRMKEKEKFFQAIDSEFTTMFGDGNSLHTWQRLLVMFGFVGDIPGSINKCRKILSRYYINIYDFLHYCRRMGISDEEGAHWNLSHLDKGSLEKLRIYSKKNSLLYPLDFARGTVLKAFLVHMF